MPPAKYKLTYLKSADTDLADIFTYIAAELAAPEAAARLLEKIESAAGQLLTFPYAHPLYPAGVDTAPFEFRALIVESYPALYYVVDDTVTIARVVYGGRDIQAILSKTANP